MKRRNDMNYPHLIETTMRGYTQRTYIIGLDFTERDLNEEEKFILKRSEEYVRDFEVMRDRRLLKKAYDTFEKLRDIDGLPEEAVSILKEWTYKEGDEE